MENNQNPQGQENPQGGVPDINTIIGEGFQTSTLPTNVQPEAPAENAPQGTQAPVGTAPGIGDGQDPLTPAEQAQTQEVTHQQDEVTLLLSGDDSKLTEEEKELKYTTLNTFNAVNVDVKGNLINKDGRIVLSKEALDKYIETGEGTYDAKGNMINELGEILMTAENIQAHSTLVDVAKTKIEEELGFKLNDKDGNPKVYENSPEGTLELVKDVAFTTELNAVSAFLQNNPKLKEVFFHLQAGGDLKEFATNDIDYKTIDVTQLDRDNKLSYIKHSLEKQGIKNGATILKTIEQASDEVVTQAAADAIIALTALKEEDTRNKEYQMQLQAENEQKEIESYWNDIKGIINNGKLKDITIPDKEKEQFFNYLALPINNKQQSQEMVDEANEDDEFRLMVSYLRYKKYNLADLINLKAKGNKLEGLRSRVGKANPRIENAEARTKYAQRGATDFPTLDSIM